MARLPSTYCCPVGSRSDRDSRSVSKVVHGGCPTTTAACKTLRQPWRNNHPATILPAPRRTAMLKHEISSNPPHIGSDTAAAEGRRPDMRMTPASQFLAGTLSPSEGKPLESVQIEKRDYQYPSEAVSGRNRIRRCTSVSDAARSSAYASPAR